MQVENSEIYLRKHTHKHTKPYIKGFWILLFITLIEVMIPLMGWPRVLSVSLLLTFTLLKAGYIVMIFMHLGEEKRDMAVTILAPTLFMLCFAMSQMNEGGFTFWSRNLLFGF